MIQQIVKPLVAGERLCRDEFLRRWEAMPEIKRAELIGGVVYMPSPVGLDHGDSHSDVGYWLSHYAVHTPGCRSSNNATALMLSDAPQPECHLRILPEYGGRTKREGNLLSGAPELTAEVSVSSTPYDLNEKLELYRQAGVQEYLIVLPEKREVRWLRWEAGQFVPLVPSPDGLLRSKVFPGLWLDPRALIEGNMARVLEAVQQGLKSAEHETFVKELAAKRGPH